MQPSLPERQLAIRRAILGYCRLLGWAPVNELPLPASGTSAARRADIMALRPDQSFVCIEIKSGPRDFLGDTKWPDYQHWCDQLFFAVDETFPSDLIPVEAGLIIASVASIPPGVVGECATVREAPIKKLASARRRALTHRFATIAASRLALLNDPAITASLRATGHASLRAD